jgi:hypothetical protein
LIIGQGVKEWLSKNARRKRIPARIGEIKTWNVRKVVMYFHKEEIKTLCHEISGAKAGADYISRYSEAVQRFIDELPDETIEDYRQAATEWNSKGTPLEVRRQ